MNACNLNYTIPPTKHCAHKQLLTVIVAVVVEILSTLVFNNCRLQIGKGIEKHAIHMLHPSHFFLIYIDLHSIRVFSIFLFQLPSIFYCVWKRKNNYIRIIIIVQKAAKENICFGEIVILQSQCIQSKLFYVIIIVIEILIFKCLQLRIVKKCICKNVFYIKWKLGIINTLWWSLSF